MEIVTVTQSEIDLINFANKSGTVLFISYL